MSFCNYSGSSTQSKFPASPFDPHIRRRTGYNSAGQGTHSGAESVRINTTFYREVDAWVHSLCYTARKHTNLGEIRWVGHIGVFGHCESSSYSAHHTGNAWDLTKIQWANAMVDTNWSHRQSQIAHRRRYLATATSLRRRFDVVLTKWYNAAHGDHIHFDTGATLGPISEGSRSDTTLMQASCVLLNGANIAVDGAWGPKTEEAFRALRKKVGFTGDIRGSLADTKAFLQILTVRGLKNQPA